LLLDNEVGVDGHSLQTREQRVAPIEMTPTRLHESDGRVGEAPHRTTQEVTRRNEVGVEDRVEIGETECHPKGQGSRFEAGAFSPTHMLHQEPVGAPVQCGLTDAGREGLAGAQRDEQLVYESGRAVVGVVEHLDDQPLGRIVELEHPLEQALHDVQFVEEGELDGYHRAPGWRSGVPHRPHATIAPREIQTVQPIHGQAERRDDIDE